jgi:hypothetical protein
MELICVYFDIYCLLRLYCEQDFESLVVVLCVISIFLNKQKYWDKCDTDMRISRCSIWTTIPLPLTDSIILHFKSSYGILSLSYFYFIFSSFIQRLTSACRKRMNEIFPSASMPLSYTVHAELFIPRNRYFYQCRGCKFWFWNLRDIVPVGPYVCRPPITLLPVSQYSEPDHSLSYIFMHFFRSYWKILG